jgi:hypothetical protein
VTTSPTDFADWLLAGIGDDPTQDAADVPLVVDWEAQEGGQWNNSAHYNPLNTTLPLDGSTVLSGGGAAAAAGVQAYSSWQDGLQATIDTLVDTKNSAGGQLYAPILAALAENNPTTAAQAIVNSPWGTTSVTYDGNRYTRGAATSPSTTGSTTTTPATSGASSTGGPGTESAGFISGLTGGVWDSVKPFLLEAMFGVGAIAIVVLGTKQLVQPTIDKVAPAVKSAATTGAEMAAL